MCVATQQVGEARVTPEPSRTLIMGPRMATVPGPLCLILAGFRYTCPQQLLPLSPPPPRHVPQALQ